MKLYVAMKLFLCDALHANYFYHKNVVLFNYKSLEEASRSVCVKKERVCEKRSCERKPIILQHTHRPNSPTRACSCTTLGNDIVLAVTVACSQQKHMKSFLHTHKSC